MARTGTFTRDEDGSYTGTIRTLSLDIKARFVPTEPSQNEKAPDLRALAGNVEIGAAWKRLSKENTVYHSTPDALPHTTEGSGVRSRTSTRRAREPARSRAACARRPPTPQPLQRCSEPA